MNKPVPAIQKRKTEAKSVDKKDIEGRLRKTFIELLAQQDITDLEVGLDCMERILKAMRAANKLGYTNGFIKSAPR